jgi:hypothetical protein
VRGTRRWGDVKGGDGDKGSDEGERTAGGREGGWGRDERDLMVEEYERWGYGGMGGGEGDGGCRWVG